MEGLVAMDEERVQEAQATMSFVMMFSHQSPIVPLFFEIVNLFCVNVAIAMGLFLFELLVLGLELGGLEQSLFAVAYSILVLEMYLELLVVGLFFPIASCNSRWLVQRPTNVMDLYYDIYLVSMIGLVVPVGSTLCGLWTCSSEKGRNCDAMYLFLCCTLFLIVAKGLLLWSLQLKEKFILQVYSKAIQQQQKF